MRSSIPIWQISKKPDIVAQLDHKPWEGRQVTLSLLHTSKTVKGIFFSNDHQGLAHFIHPTRKGATLLTTRSDFTIYPWEEIEEDKEVRSLCLEQVLITAHCLNDLKSCREPIDVNSAQIIKDGEKGKYKGVLGDKGTAHIYALKILDRRLGVEKEGEIPIPEGAKVRWHKERGRENSFYSLEIKDSNGKTIVPKVLYPHPSYSHEFLKKKK